ncbi:MAG TPA: 4-(cytidine 5'-diphospho)-2-C-methyl-D-erythritol kinase [Dehalococcoidia bacterium]|nr:4-(cytidine 5'-diphospho)-2-C-methyl-D-erythritol kinase [Dehalococcoidia bacterium]
MTVRVIAPAKINWTLEVLGKRPDRYHEIRSVMQTIDLCDELRLSPAPELRRQQERPRRDAPPGTLYLRGILPHQLNWSGYVDLPPDYGLLPGTDVVYQATRLLDTEGERDVTISLTKRIPIAAGLGGGSSDAAATLRGLDRLWNLGLPREKLARVAQQIGSDVAFFLMGGTALAEGRGEVITQLADAREMWLVVVAPPIFMPEKTKTMYGTLRGEDFGDEGRTEALAERLKRGEGVREDDLCNAFERAAYESFEGLAGYRDRLLGAGAARVHVAGAGPALFAMFGSRDEGEAVAERLSGPEAKVFVARTLGAEEATRIVVSE